MSLVRIEDIAVDQSINLREVDMVTVSQYSEAMERGDKFPAIGVVDDGEAKWLYAGFHRIQAAQEAGLEHFEAEVRDGTRHDAEALACAENAEHGKPRSNQEKRDAVKKMRHLYPDWSDRQIARWVKVSNHLVARVDATHTGNIPSMDQERTFIHHKTGQPTTMKTANIGVKPEATSTDAEADQIKVVGLPEPESEEEYTRRKRQEQGLLETLPEVVEPKSDIVASSPTDPAAIRLRQENEDKKAYAEIVLWLNTYARELGGFNLKFNGLIRKYGVPKIATALEVLNTEHRVDDLATQCYLILEKIEQIGGKSNQSATNTARRHCSTDRPRISANF